MVGLGCSLGLRFGFEPWPYVARGARKRTSPLVAFRIYRAKRELLVMLGGEMNPGPMWMDEILHHEMKPWLKPLFVGVYVGESTPSRVSWVVRLGCRETIHSTGQLQEGSLGFFVGNGVSPEAHAVGQML